MLPRPERLSTRAFSQAFSQGRTWRHSLLQVRVASRDEADRRGKISDVNATKEKQNAPRAAFVVAKKLAKAATRNRLRRQMREAYRLNPHRHDWRLHDMDLIFLAAPAAFDASPEDLRAATNQLLERTLRGRPAVSSPIEMP